MLAGSIGGHSTVASDHLHELVLEHYDKTRALFYYSVELPLAVASADGPPRRLSSARKPSLEGTKTTETRP